MNNSQLKSLHKKIMPDPHWESLKEIFNAAVALAPADRAAYLDKVVDGDVSLRAAVESLFLA